MTRRDEGYGWWTDDEPVFSRDESQGPVQRPSIFESIFVGALVGLAALVVITQVLR